MPNIVYTVAERVEMVRQHEQGLSYRCIVDYFAATYPDRPIPSKSSVRKIVQQFHETGNLDPSLTKVSYPQKQLTEDMKLKICLAAQESPKKPLSKIAEELHISKSSVHKVLRTLKLRPCKYQNRRKLLLPSKNDKKKTIQTDSSSPPPCPPTSTPLPPSSSPFPPSSSPFPPSSSLFPPSSSPLHLSLWNYLRDKLDSENRSEDLETVWDRVKNVLGELDEQIIFKINSAMDTAPEQKVDILNLVCKVEPS